MTVDKMIKGLIESAKMEHIRNVIRYLLNGSIEKVVNIHKRELHYISSLEMDEFMEKDEFLESEAGELLIKYFKYMYDNFPDELSYQFANFPLKYKIYKILGFSDEFVKKDFENNLEIKNKEIFWNSCKYFVNYFGYLANEYIQNYKEYSNNLLMKLGMLIIIKNIELMNEGKVKDEKEIKALDNIFINYIASKINKSGESETFEKYLDSSNFRRHFQSTEILEFEEIRKYLEKRFFEVVIENSKISDIISEGIKLFVIFSGIEFSPTNHNYNYRNRMSKKIIENFEKYDFSQGQKVYLLVNYGSNTVFENLRNSEIMYNLFKDTIKEDLENTKSILCDNLNENRLEYSFLLHFFIRGSLIDEDEKDKLLKKSENILIDNLKGLFAMKSWEWNPIDFKNLDFLQENNINWEDISVNCQGNKAAVILVKKSKIIFSLLKYSNMYQKIFKFLIKCIKRVNIFKDIFIKYTIIYGVDNLRQIMDELWNYELPISFINEKYFEYIEKNGNGNKNNKFWIEFLHAHEEELYESFENNNMPSEIIEKYVNILYLEDNGFDYSKLPGLLVRAEKALKDKIREILKNQMDKEKVRLKVEEIFKTKSDSTKHIAGSLIRYWNNIKAQEGIESLADSRDIVEYADSLCLEKHEDNAVFSTEVDYNSVRIKDENKRIPSKLMKYYISEYILAKDIKCIEICNRIEEIAEKEDLRKFVEKIFDRWKAHKFNPKYKNLFVPLIRTANLEQISEMVNIVDMLVSEYNKIAVAAYGIRVLTLRKEVKEIGILLNGFRLNYKDKRIRIAADEALGMIAEREGISRDELNDILVPDFNFGMDRTKIFNYGEKKIKAILEIEEEPQKVILYDENGRSMRSFPRTNQKRSNRNSILESCKKELKYIKKQLRVISVVQVDSLLKSFFSQRKWQVKKWQEVFIKNPVMQKYAILLVWKEIDSENKIINTFRYTENGTFETINGKEYKLGNDSYINLLYFPEVSDNEQEYWKKYFKEKKISQLIRQADVPVYKLTEKNQENIEIIDYNDKEFTIKELRKQSSKLGFEISCGNDGMAYGIHYYDENTKTKIVIMTDSFFPREYSKISKIRKILFFKDNVSFHYEDILQSMKRQNIKPLKLKDVSDRVLSLACYVSEIL